MLEASQSSFDVNFSQADDIIPGIGTEGVEGLSHTSYVPEFDPSQTNKGDEWWTPRTSVRDSIAPLPSHWEKWNEGKELQLTDSPLRTYSSPQSSLENYIGENLEIDSIMYSANSSSTLTDRVAKQRRIPTRCKCSEAVSRFTSKTVKNPGRLFHRCSMGSELVVGEIEDFQDLFDVLLVDIIKFQKSVRAGEAMMKGHESRIKEM
ncbi:hypothetical protein HID58_077188 [Brassica napus]|uniref:Zinc finger GRF-type domain-containing protein n=1 Tax=Brassica napus TaxID=3708 RepID=A0ABQ7YPR1_BRANA|nr:hypothetical protein HID58_077188 [Brassica napus]